MEPNKGVQDNCINTINSGVESMHLDEDNSDYQAVLQLARDEAQRLILNEGFDALVHASSTLESVLEIQKVIERTSTRRGTRSSGNWFFPFSAAEAILDAVVLSDDTNALEQAMETVQTLKANELPYFENTAAALLSNNNNSVSDNNNASNNNATINVDNNVQVLAGMKSPPGWHPTRQAATNIEKKKVRAMHHIKTAIDELEKLVGKDKKTPLGKIVKRLWVAFNCLADTKHRQVATTSLVDLPMDYLTKRSKWVEQNKHYLDECRSGSCWTFLPGIRISCNLAHCTIGLSSGGVKLNVQVGELMNYVQTSVGKVEMAKKYDVPLRAMNCSHLCHLSACCNPNHVVMEPDDANLRRNTCRLRGKCACLLDPPCLLDCHSAAASHDFSAKMMMNKQTVTTVQSFRVLAKQTQVVEEDDIEDFSD